MPKKLDNCVKWSEPLQMYEVFHDNSPFGYGIYQPSDFHYWLDRLEMKAFHFCSSAGYSMTLRAEKKQRGDTYWYAYKRLGGKVCKKYLGDISKLDLRGLADVARSLAEGTNNEPPPAKEPPRQPTFRFTKTLDSALEIFNLPGVPDKKTLITRYRDLSKKHHPDHGGLHEDMVAINLSLEYLRSFVR